MIWFKWCKGALILLFVCSYIIGMESGDDVVIPIQKTVITDFFEAQRVASLSKQDRKSYTLAPDLVAYIIKKDMVEQNDEAKNCITDTLFEISPKELEIVGHVQQQGDSEYGRLENQIYVLLQQDEQKNFLQNVRGRLYYYELCMLYLSNKEIQKRQKKIDLYKTYKPHVIPGCWALSLVAEFVILGAIVCVALHTCG
jgi:hypothetical protein